MSRAEQCLPTFRARGISPHAPWMIRTLIHVQTLRPAFSVAVPRHGRAATTTAKWTRAGESLRIGTAPCTQRRVCHSSQAHLCANTPRNAVHTVARQGGAVSSDPDRMTVPCCALAGAGWPPSCVAERMRRRKRNLIRDKVGPWLRTTPAPAAPEKPHTAAPDSSLW